MQLADQECGCARDPFNTTATHHHPAGAASARRPWTCVPFLCSWSVRPRTRRAPGAAPFRLLWLTSSSRISAPPSPRRFLGWPSIPVHLCLRHCSRSCVPFQLLGPPAPCCSGPGWPGSVLPSRSSLVRGYGHRLIPAASHSAQPCNLALLRSSHVQRRPVPPPALCAACLPAVATPANA